MTTPPHADRLIDVGDELRLHVVVAGQGPAVVLLHGFTGSVRTWTPLSSRLANACTTIAIDLPGHGASTAPVDPSRYALTRFADDVCRVLDVLDVPLATILGYSMGGRAALQIGLRYPARVKALVLESTSPGMLDVDERAARVGTDNELAMAIERHGIPAFVDRWERLPLWESQTSLSDAVRAGLRAQRLENDARGLANSLRGAGAGIDTPVVDRLAALRVPVLLLAGALDTKYVTLARLMERRLPEARLAIVAGSGHAVHLERPEEFAREVEQFLVTVQTR